MRKYNFAYESEIIRGNAEAGRIAKSCPRHRQRATKKMALAGLAYCVRYHRVMSTLTEASHQIHAGVDDPPHQIAAERGNQHRADRHLICSRDTDGARDRQRHYQAEQNFGEPLNRFEYTPKQPHGIARRTCILLRVQRGLQGSTGATRKIDRSTSLLVKCASLRACPRRLHMDFRPLVLGAVLAIALSPSAIAEPL